MGTHRHRPARAGPPRSAHRPDGTPVEGWGECAALADTTYDAEDADERLRLAGGRRCCPACCGRRSGRARSRRSAGSPALVDAAAAPAGLFAAVEMAVADAHLRAAGRSFADLLGVAGTRVPPGAVLGLPRSVGAAGRRPRRGWRGRLRPGEGQGRSRAPRPSIDGGRAAPAGLGTPRPGRRQRHLRRRRRRSAGRRSTTSASLCIEQPLGRGRPRRPPPPRRRAWPRRSAWTRAWTAPARRRRGGGDGRVLGGVRQAGPARGDRRCARRDRLVRGQRRAVVDRRDVRVGLRPGGQPGTGRTARPVAARRPGPADDLPGRRPGRARARRDRRPDAATCSCPCPTGPGLGTGPGRRRSLEPWSVRRRRVLTRPDGLTSVGAGGVSTDSSGSPVGTRPGVRTIALPCTGPSSSDA